jgi:hypothetical protein
MPVNLIQLAESLSAYKNLYAPNDPNYKLNPPVHAHHRFVSGGQSLSVLSRVVPYGSDYSGRTNKLAHHVIARSNEMASMNPAMIMTQEGFFLEQWESKPQHLPSEKRIPACPDLASPATNWKTVTGDAGWAGVVAQSYLDTPTRPVVLVFEPGMEMLPLLAEVIQLLPPERRSAVTFNTYLTSMIQGTECWARCCLPGSDVLRETRRTSGVLVVDLTDISSSAGKNPENAGSALVECARTGNHPQWPPASVAPDANARTLHPVSVQGAAQAEERSDTGARRKPPKKPLVLKYVTPPNQGTSTQYVKPSPGIPTWAIVTTCGVVTTLLMIAAAIMLVTPHSKDLTDIQNKAVASDPSEVIPIEDHAGTSPSGNDTITPDTNIPSGHIEIQNQTKRLKGELEAAFSKIIVLKSLDEGIALLKEIDELKSELDDLLPEASSLQESKHSQMERGPSWEIEALIKRTRDNRKRLEKKIEDLKSRPAAKPKNKEPQIIEKGHDSVILNLLGGNESTVLLVDWDSSKPIKFYAHGTGELIATTTAQKQEGFRTTKATTYLRGNAKSTIAVLNKNNLTMAALQHNRSRPSATTERKLDPCAVSYIQNNGSTILTWLKDVEVPLEVHSAKRNGSGFSILHTSPLVTLVAGESKMSAKAKFSGKNKLCKATIGKSSNREGESELRIEIDEADLDKTQKDPPTNTKKETAAPVDTPLLKELERLRTTYPSDPKTKGAKAKKLKGELREFLVKVEISALQNEARKEILHKLRSRISSDYSKKSKQLAKEIEETNNKKGNKLIVSLRDKLTLAKRTERILKSTKTGQQVWKDLFYHKDQYSKIDFPNELLIKILHHDLLRDAIAKVPPTKAREPNRETVVPRRLTEIQLIHPERPQSPLIRLSVIGGDQ